MTTPKASRSRPRKRGNVAERVVEEVESRFLAAVEVATSTTSAEENLASAAVEAIVGHRDQDAPTSSLRRKAVKSKRPRRRSKS